jgi:hypothetical protein
MNMKPDQTETPTPGSVQPVGSARNTYGELAGLYSELLYAVASKFPGESRHDTALRYIREREADHNPSAGVEATLPNAAGEPQPRKPRT